MQRRAAAVYFVFFLVIGAGAYGFLTVAEAQQPEVQLDEPAYQQNETLTVDGREYTVAEISAEEGEEGGQTVSGTLEWENQTANGTETESVSLEEGTNVTLNGQTYLVHFPDTESVQLTTDFQAYQRGIDRQDYYQERRNGLLSVSLISLSAAVVLLGAAYLPVKD